MRIKKILNDPVYGFISIPEGIVFDLIEHPYFQRLRRIKQVSLTHYVYPGALHTRFHHALGAFHLTTQAIEVLRSKGVKITRKEATAVSIAILLHDIGHGPFSHTLEHSLIGTTHEALSALFMEKLNEEFDGRLRLAIAIFQDRYKKKFLHQLVSGQLDMDRMDYLNRDSFFTGVYEGVIGYDRIIKMLSVHKDYLVVEEKGLYSIEKFLIARRLMYWQVYLHKTVLVAEQMLVQILKRARFLVREGVKLPASPELSFFLERQLSAKDFEADRDRLLQNFAALDDIDLIAAIKAWMHIDDPVLSFFAKGLINRRLFRIELRQTPFKKKYVKAVKKKVLNTGRFQKEHLDYFVFQGKETNRAYSRASEEEIKILFKDGKVKPMSSSVDYGLQSAIVTKYYLCYPKNI